MQHRTVFITVQWDKFSAATWAGLEVGEKKFRYMDSLHFLSFLFPPFPFPHFPLCHFPLPGSRPIWVPSLGRQTVPNAQWVENPVIARLHALWLMLATNLYHFLLRYRAAYSSHVHHVAVDKLVNIPTTSSSAIAERPRCGGVFALAKI